MRMCASDIGERGGRAGIGCGQACRANGRQNRRMLVL